MKGNTFVTGVLNGVGGAPTAVQKWNIEYQSLNWKKIFLNTFRITIDAQLRWFQTRLLHRILPTNKYLHKCKIIPSALCSFCTQEEDSISHLFWSCDNVNTFWMELQLMLKDKSPKCTNLAFHEKLILFGSQSRTENDVVIELIILLAKFYIYKCKLEKIIPRTNVFLNMLRHRYRILKYAAFVSMQNDTFDMDWTAYQSIISS